MTNMTPAELKAIRVALGLTQVKFAARLGLSPANGANYISKMEGGREPISKRTARMLAAIAFTD